MSNADELARRARLRVVGLAARKAIHLGPALSLIDVLAALYTQVLRHDPARPDCPDRDLLVLSKGHGAYGLYAVLAELGVLTTDLDDLPGHPSDGIPGVEAATGALGHGLSLAGGLALGARLTGSDRRVYVVMGDGELDEGSNWEAAQFAAHHRLGNLMAVVDRNRLQQEGDTEDICALEPLADKWRAFGWRVGESDGHDVAAVAEAVTALGAGPGPAVLIAHTTKGKGVPFAQGDPAWHMGQLDAAQHHIAVTALTATA
ncbi:transketolase [Streptomyces longwoodensis]|uniref:Amc3a n=1 Tax=Streptomyces novoguineensis TaxID=2586640 RepID=A0A4Y5QS50_9ACTN|nr:Amc3a [Streptomyces novoguineensis]QHW08560.1 transketolase [Streptomyces novoguineensis]BBE52679.1 transketolase N-terminal domain containing protein [Streptomyces sp.]